MKILILTANDPRKRTSWENEAKKIGDISINSIYKYQPNWIIRGIRKIHKIFPIPGYQIWFDNWWEQLNHTDIVIAIAYDSTYKIFKLIKKKYPNIRRILYWWDPVEKTISPEKVDNAICEKWSFSIRDAEKYNLKYNSQFFARNLDICKRYKEEIKYDVMFLGTGDGKLYQKRIEELQKFDNICREIKIVTFFGIKYRTNFDSNLPFALKHYIEEKEYYKVAMQSKAMLDITEPGHEWMTLRPIEALFLGKKLITNNKDIVKEALYTPENVFILGKDSYKKLKEFINNPLKELPDRVYKYYFTKSWLERFGIQI